jgi:hypothetical protein
MVQQGLRKARYDVRLLIRTARVHTSHFDNILDLRGPVQARWVAVSRLAELRTQPERLACLHMMRHSWFVKTEHSARQCNGERRPRRCLYRHCVYKSVNSVADTEISFVNILSLLVRMQLVKSGHAHAELKLALGTMACFDCNRIDL